jgi:ribokinase
LPNRSNSSNIDAMKPRVTVVGSANTDMIIKLARIPCPGETILGGEFATAAGGKGANQAVGAARAGAQVTFVARVGGDSLGDQAIQGYQRDGICVDYVFRDRLAPSGVALIFVAQDGENSIAVASGANAKLSPKDVQTAERAIAKSDVLLTQLETPLATVRAALVAAHKAGVPVVLNPAPARPLPGTILKLVSILTPNETEAELLTGIRVKTEASIRHAAEVLLRRGVMSVVMTLGSRGALIATRDGHEFVSGYRVKAVDTTAAGDIFNGALAVALAEGKGLRESVAFANAAAALSVTKLGAQPSAPKRSEILRLSRTP